MLGESLRRRLGRRKGRRPREPGGRIRLRVWVPAALVVVALAFGGGYAVAALVLFPAPPEPGGAVIVPSLLGSPLANASVKLGRVGLKLGEVSNIPSDRPPGTILAQAPLPEQQLRPGAAVDVEIAASRPAPVVPALRGLGVDAALALLQLAGLDVKRVDRTDSSAVGQVLAVQPPPGTAVAPPGPVTLIVSSGPPMDTLSGFPGVPADTVPADTGGTGMVRP
jgi:beta-lactam-binding protein with PASTA domain